MDALPQPPVTPPPAAGPITLIATAAFGLEAVVSRELERLGYADRTVEDGRVTFQGDESGICRTNLWLRSADRVLVRLGEFEARDFGELFDRTRDLPWSDWLPVDAAFPVRAKSVRSRLHSVPDVQSLVKKAIVESLKRQHRREWFEETGATFGVEASILKDRVTVTIDTSGPGLHKRGYRTLVGPAPLKETLAAALIQLSYWNPDRPRVDPQCGSGTIVIEAALMARNRAPGLERSFAAEHWPRISPLLWSNAREEARAAIASAESASIIGTDADDDALRMARYHARAAGVESSVHFQRKTLAEFSTSRQYGCVITNPPYGERSGERHEAEALYREMGRVLGGLDTWSIYVLTAHERFEQFFGRQAGRRRKLYNGRIPCTYYQFPGPRPPVRESATA
jgi:putative N6-adenine-specific DNA methylase